ncbi:hypothetical protein Bhyg_07855 [Pseudolycoriella hygida]|uniref:Uncharacterized protein n=1 Tax=Pseudolycoriella hygida TaxID=35572 RepID=A0A9Q0S341_9DIPT|nr:hypothetical protein Bhyg_07855 [Pseudolycoriella hygida]
METITVKRGDTTYLLLNLSTERATEFRNDSLKLAEYFTACIQTESNICIRDIDGNSSSVSSDESRLFGKKFFFLCGPPNFVYAVKFDKHEWHYFDVLDSIIARHRSLPSSVNSLIGGLSKVKSVSVNLNDDQSKNYFYDGKFVFEDKELMTFMDLGDNQPQEYNKLKPSELKSTHLVFISGETNPLLFINQFEKCIDVKADKDKMYNIRHFVDESHRAEFSRLFFTSDWQSVKSAFIQIYSLSFVVNKKREMCIDFDESSSLRSFMERKLTSLSKFTTLPFLNQVEIALNDLPIEISNLFIVNEKMTSKKSQILDFCDTIEEIVETWRKTVKVGDNVDETEQESNRTENQTEPVNRMEVFHFTSSEPSRGVGRGAKARGGRGGYGQTANGGIKKRGRPPKKLATVVEDDGDLSDFLNQIDNTSRSSWSDAQ